MSGPRVTVVVVAYEAGDYLQPCIDSLALQGFADFEAVVVDNNSTDGSVDGLQLPDARFRVDRAGANLGFAAANNRAARASRAEFIALLNPDATADPAWLATLVAAADAHGEAASFGSLQVRLDDADRLDGVGDVWHAAGLAWRAGEGWAAERAPGDGPILGPCGAAALYRRGTFVDIGGFEESFFCYCEDVDLALRLRMAGWTSWRASGAVVRHAGSGVSGRASDFTLFHGHRNRVWAFVRNTPGGWFWALLPFHLAFNALYLALAWRRGFHRPVWRAYKAAWAGRRAAWRERRGRPRGGFARLRPVVVWVPWAPWSRTLKPSAAPAGRSER